MVSDKTYKIGVESLKGRDTVMYLPKSETSFIVK